MKTLLTLFCVGLVLTANAQLNVSAVSTPYTINFDVSVSDVINGQYAGAGLQPFATAGELDSDAWEILGMSEGDFLFGATNNTAASDAARGQSPGAIGTGGLYAFEVLTGDYAFGFQPGGSDVTPGEITLKIQNNTGGYIGSFDVAYEAWQNNDQPRANSLNFSYSYDNVDFVSVPALDFTTIEALDANGWVSQNMAATISGLSIPAGDFFYLRWETDDVSGSGIRDEIAFDDFSLTAYVQPPTVNFGDFYYRVNEDGATVNVELSLTSNNGSTSAIKVKALTESTAGIIDYIMASGTSFTGTTDETINFTININDDATAEATEYIAIYLEDSTNGVAGEDYEAMVYILDNDFTAPVASESIQLEFIDSIYVQTGGSAEISAFDPTTNKLYTANSILNFIEVFDLSDPYDISLITSLDISSYGNLNSIDVYNDTVAIAVANSTDKTLDGSIVFFQGDGTHLNTVTAGANPDMVVFTPDHTKVLSANEGEPNDAYTTDPEGTITIIDITAGVANAVATQVNFNAYDSQIGTLKASGVRIFGPGSSVSQDFEPEYITIDESSTTAWITLQENNAIAVLNIATATITDIFPLGVKDHSLPGNGLDITNDSDTILIANWPVYGMYMPDAIAHYSVGGNTYLVTANEGDSRDYSGYSEEERLKDVDLEDTDFGQFEHFLMVKENAGRVKITSANGDNGNDGDFDSVFVYGGRSFSIWDTNGNQVYDSGDDFEQILAQDATWNQIFNCSNDNVDFKDRSDDKGPEPEGVAVGVINDTVYAFITLERMGGVMVYNVTNPTSPIFVQYINNRAIATPTGDLGPEGIIFIDSLNSPIDTALVVVSNEVSGTVSVFKVNQYYIPDVTGIDEEVATNFMIYPNPVKDVLFFNAKTDVQIYDLSGQLVLSGNQTDRINVAELTNGLYLIRNADGNTMRFVKQ
ncbi:MAG: choice-of-anchor I family protein [Crocinitomicaceae bacterium]|nr:T9SS type A sorting domain-containing protein [Crocinitomicaceae bacterium]